MTITALGPNAALVLIDLQKGILSKPTAQPARTVLENAAALAAAFRRRGLPVVLVRVVGQAPGRVERPLMQGEPPPGWTELAPELDRQPGDRLIEKRSWGAFSGTGLEALLRERDAAGIVLGGVATSIGVETTARQAYELGFNVTLATDAMTDYDPDAHRNSVERVFPKLGETGTVREVIGLIEGAVADR